MPDLPRRQRGAPHDGDPGNLRIAKIDRPALALTPRRQGRAFARRVPVERQDAVLKTLGERSLEGRFELLSAPTEEEGSSGKLDYSDTPA
jgi:hypothetical protein